MNTAQTAAMPYHALGAAKGASLAVICSHGLQSKQLTGVAVCPGVASRGPPDLV